MAYRSLADKITSMAQMPKQEFARTTVNSIEHRKTRGDINYTAGQHPWMRESKKVEWSARMSLRDGSNTHHYGRVLRKAMKFRPEPAVQDAMLKMCERTEQAKLQQALKFARPPFPITWFEFENASGMTCGVLVREGLDKDGELEKLHVNFFYDPDPRNPNTMPNTDLATGLIIRKDSIERIKEAVPLPFGGNTAKTKILRLTSRALELSKYFIRTAHEQDVRFEVKMALSMMLLMNSRSGVIKADVDQEAFEQLNDKAKARNLTPIKFDLSRILENAKGKLSPEDAEKIQAESLVRGHLKLRKTGVFWWDPHLRNKREGVSKETAMEEQLTRDRTLQISGDPEALDIPDNTPGT